VIVMFSFTQSVFMSSDDIETFAVFDPMVLDPEALEVESLIEDGTPLATRPSVALCSPPDTSGMSFTVFHSPLSNMSGLTREVGVGLVSLVFIVGLPVSCVAGSSEICGRAFLLQAC
jgi:hypothetical protein